MKPKALFISSRPIYPIICGGQIRTEQALEFLSRSYDVDVNFLSEDSTPEISPYLKYAKTAQSFYRSKFKCIIGTLRFIFNKLPLQVNYFYDSKMQSHINHISTKYDLIFCNNIRTTEYARKSKFPNKIVDFVDAISMNYDKARKHSTGIKKLIYGIDYHRCRNYEKELVKEFDACAIISEIDKKYIESCQE